MGRRPRPLGLPSGGRPRSAGAVALGAFEAGAYAGLEDAGGPLPDWFVGASIGAVNAATGRRPSDRDVTRVVQAGVRRRWL